MAALVYDTQAYGPPGAPASYRNSAACGPVDGMGSSGRFMSGIRRGVATDMKSCALLPALPFETVLAPRNRALAAHSPIDLARQQHGRIQGPCPFGCARFAEKADVISRLDFLLFKSLFKNANAIDASPAGAWALLPVVAVPDTIDAEVKLLRQL